MGLQQWSALEDLLFTVETNLIYLLYCISPTSRLFLKLRVEDIRSFSAVYNKRPIP